MMNMKYKTYFIFQSMIPLILFGVYFINSRSNLTLIIAILAVVRLISLGVNIHKENLWNSINRQHDQRTRSNAYFAGYISFWSMLICLLIGAILIKNSIIVYDYLQLIVFTFMLGIMMMLVVRDYMNLRE
ncbi:hypothetical protein WQ54_07040 [Bacillus sp. SA1-12]|uniref:hypothetical protein n=1 Tax=Bacillus sp. SA1-12 TaxID=1455638 RepID=UPI0006256A4C|nr:hypothetical protein [Bacillus sp. SA1-12]KKI92925.1 hypothetical protein WQ54_07040 [Bacillus sp. SA1-12]